MAWFPISHSVLQYDNSSGALYSGAVLKPYSAGTSTPINFAIDSVGASTVGSIVLNASGNPAVSGNVVIPYVEEKYKLVLYPTQAAADANTGAIWTIDNIPISGDFGGATQTISTSTALDAADQFNHIEASGTITITMPDITGVGAGHVNTIRNAGTGTVTVDGDGAETINGAASIYLAPGDSVLMISGTTSWAGMISRAPYGDKGTAIASATTTNIWASTGELVHITGTTTITSLGTASRAGEVRVLIFDGAVQLTHNASTLVVPGGANYTTAADDIVVVRADTTTKHYLTVFKAGGGVIGGLLAANNLSDVANAATAFGNIKQAATTAATGVVELATDAEVKTGTDSARVSPVSSMIFHEGIAKGWVDFIGTGTVTINDSFNVTSITDNGTGNYTVNWTTSFATANYPCVITSGSVGSDTFCDRILAKAAGSIQFQTASHTPVVADATYNNVIALGDR